MHIRISCMFKVALYLLLFGMFDFVTCSVYNHLKHFETLHSSQLSHSIVKRGIKYSDHPFNKIKEVTFNTLGRDFRLILTPRKGILHSEFKAFTVDGDGQEKPVFVDHDNFYDGRLFGEVSSEASVHLEDGLMTASIHTPEEIYHIEPSWRHLPHLDNQSMIAYRESDVYFTWSHEKGKGDTDTWPRTCSYVREEEEEEEEEEEDEGSEDSEDDDGSTKIRNKRQAEPYQHTPTKTRCSLLLVADYRFYQEMGGSNTKKTINYIISMIDRVDKIYNDTTWKDRQEQDGFKGMGFVIKKIVVHSEPTRVHGGEAHYNMVQEKWAVRNLLELFCRYHELSNVCLGHLFTHQTFDADDSGVLGLAYIASPRLHAIGGICSFDYFKNGYTLYLNSGLSSSRNHYGQRVITREAELVTAHEFGHNWGSDHDPDIPECSPSASQGGSYIMHTYSVSGNDVNNKRFSPCSLRSIRKVLLAKSGRCFSQPKDSFCGNLRVEGNEECDAGLLGTEDNDACCDKNCKLRRNQGAVCSDKNSPCCQNCQFMSEQMKCRDAQPATCEEESHCTGASSECPRSLAMTDGTPCPERGQCQGGNCMPYCETQGLQSCMCDIIAVSCKRCCRKKLNDTCFTVDPQDILPDGTPCIQGFCNKGVCEKTILDVVERIWDIIEDININKVLVFLRDNIVGTVILVTAIIWIPASCVVSHVDRKRRNAQEARDRWTNYEDENQRLFNMSVPRQRPPDAVQTHTTGPL